MHVFHMSTARLVGRPSLEFSPPASLALVLTDIVFQLCADFQENYNSRGCQPGDNVTLGLGGMGTTVTVGYRAMGVDDTGTSTSAGPESGSNECLRETSLLYLLLMLGTAWLGLSLYNFTKTYVISYEPQSPL